jgi:hypothetical protein
VPFYPWIRDPGWEKSGSGSVEQPGSYFRELKKQLFLVKILKFFDVVRDPGWKNSDPGWKKVGSGIRINIPDPQHCLFQTENCIYYVHDICRFVQSMSVCLKQIIGYRQLEYQVEKLR